jgi:hypothetical protein
MKSFFNDASPSLPKYSKSKCISPNLTAFHDLWHLYFSSPLSPTFGPVLFWLAIYWRHCSSQWSDRVTGFLDYFHRPVFRDKKHDVSETGSVSSETSCFYSLNTGRWKKSENSVTLCAIHHRKNHIKSTSKVSLILPFFISQQICIIFFNKHCCLHPLIFVKY